MIVPMSPSPGQHVRRIGSCAELTADKVNAPLTGSRVGCSARILIRVTGPEGIVSAIFPKLEGLDSLARRDGVDIRPTLVRVLTDLYVQKPAHSVRGRAPLHRAGAAPDRLGRSRRRASRSPSKIAGYAGAPPAVARRLARDVIEVAEPILRHCAALTSADLDCDRARLRLGHAAIIATKRDTPATAPPVTTAAPQPERAHRGPPAAEKSELTLAELFFSAESAARRMLLASLGNVEAEHAAERAAGRDQSGARRRPRSRRDRAGFTKLLEGALGLSRDQAERIVGDASGEPLLVAAKALAMPSVALQRVLMFIDPAIGESVDRFFDLAALYEKVSADAAHKIDREPARPRAGRARAGRRIGRCTTTTRRRAHAAAAPTRRPGVAEPQAPARTETGARQRTM